MISSSRPAPLGPFSLRYLQVVGGRTLRADWVHEKIVPYNIIAQPLTGAYEIAVKGRSALVESPSAFLTPANAPLRITHHGAGGEFRSRWAHFTFALGGGLDATTLLDLPLVLPGADGAEAGRIIQELAQPPPDRLHAALLAAGRREELAWRLFALVCRVSPLQAGAAERLAALGRMGPLVEQLRTHLSAEWSVPLMAQTAAMSIPHFHATFRVCLGTTPMAYLKRLRLEEAALQLSLGKASVKEIAAATGFANTGHLSREFKARFSLSPRAYQALTS